jgi:hypothetical protein
MMMGMRREVVVQVGMPQITVFSHGRIPSGSKRDRVSQKVKVVFW